MSGDDVYAAPRTVTDLNDCNFYHTMDVPGVGRVTGEWDLRAGAREYLGGVPFAGKRVFEMGLASGFLSFFMKREGAGDSTTATGSVTAPPRIQGADGLRFRLCDPDRDRRRRRRDVRLGAPPRARSLHRASERVIGRRAHGGLEVDPHRKRN